MLAFWWLQDKYEFKRFIPRDGSVPEKAPGSSVAVSRSAPGEGAGTRERKPRERPGYSAAVSPNENMVIMGV